MTKSSKDSKFSSHRCPRAWPFWAGHPDGSASNMANSGLIVEQVDFSKFYNCRFFDHEELIFDA